MKLAFETKDQPLQNEMSFKAYYPGTLARCERTDCSCQSTTGDATSDPTGTVT
jgi:hypothetical protein